MMLWVGKTAHPTAAIPSVRWRVLGQYLPGKGLVVER